MACKGCTCSTGNAKTGDVVAGCGSNGCSSGGCNRMNTYDWLTALDIEDVNHFDIVEISFKNGSRKDFYKNPNHSHARAITGDMVLVETDNGGFDIGRVSLSGDLVRLQMKKRNVKEAAVLQSVIRRANERDLERLQEARESERSTMILARSISRSLGLDMKVGDVEYQGDKRKATFYYTADGRVDFRELIREYAREFKVKIEMRQIGARQESARIGGLGPCGRELCCSTWLTDFKSVSTLAARYQNLAINQSKLSGQCGRLKCCLNYELDTYIDALEHFPTHADKIFTEEGAAVLMKTDIFKGLMYYCYEKDHGRGKFYPLDIVQVKEILEANKSGLKPQDLSSVQAIEEEDEDVGFDGDLTGVVELPADKKKKKKKSKKKSFDDKKVSFRKNGDDIPAPPTGGNSPRNEQKGKQDQRPRPERNDQRNEQRNEQKSEQKPRFEQRNRPDDRNKQENRTNNPEERKPNAPKFERVEKKDRPNNNNANNNNNSGNNNEQRQQPKQNQPRPERPNNNPNNQQKQERPNNPNQQQKGGNNNQQPPKNNAPKPNQDAPKTPPPTNDGGEVKPQGEGNNNPNPNKNKFKNNKFKNKNKFKKDGGGDSGGGEA